MFVVDHLFSGMGIGRDSKELIEELNDKNPLNESLK